MEPALQWIVTGLFSAGMLDSSRRVFIHLVIALWYCLQGDRSRTALRACSSSGLEEVIKSAAGEPVLCPSMFQDLADPDPLETDVAFVSNVVTRAARLLTICSIFVIFASYKATVWESVWTQFSFLDTLCMGSGNLCEHFVDFLLHRTGAVSCSFEVRKRTSRRTNSRRGAGNGESGTSVPSLARAMRKDGKLQNWAVDTWTKQNQKLS